MMHPNTISVERLAGVVRGGGLDLIDVRTPIEFREVHAVMATNVPLDRLDPQRVMQARNGNAGDPLYVICRSGDRARIACKRFVEAGYENVIVVEGGTPAWEEAGLPVRHGKRAISMERQVRIAAGLIVLVGTALGAFVHPYLLAVPAFVGAGLTFAGFTNTCGMGMLLARMPWNQVGRGESVSCAR